MAERPEQMVQARRADSAAKTARVTAALDAMVTAGEPPQISLLARRAKVSRRFIYDHPEIRAEANRRSAQVADRQAGAITASARVTAASLRADLENTKARNRRLETELNALRRRLGELIGQKALSEITGEQTPVHATRVAQLEQSLFEVEETLARRNEELDAARQINRELMARLNRDR
jgi:chromosome segregation ATPase